MLKAKGEFMQVQKVNNSPEFGAKIIIGDDGVQKFIKSSFISSDSLYWDKFSLNEFFDKDWF